MYLPCSIRLFFRQISEYINPAVFAVIKIKMIFRFFHYYITFYSDINNRLPLVAASLTFPPYIFRDFSFIISGVSGGFLSGHSRTSSGRIADKLLLIIKPQPPLQLHCIGNQRKLVVCDRIHRTTQKKTLKGVVLSRS